MLTERAGEGRGLEVPGEAFERIVAVEILLLRELLQVTDATDTPFPHPDVEENQDHEKEARDKGAIGPHALWYHQQGVEGAVHEHGHKEGKETVLGSVLGVEFGQGKIIPHHHAKEEMSGHGENSTYRAGVHGAQEAFLTKDIADILKTGKTQCHKTGVDNAVEILVELLATTNPV